MITDSLLRVSEDQAVATTAVSTNTVDLGVYEYGSTSLIRELAFISAAQSIDIDQGSAKITVQLQDQNGTPIDAIDNLVVVLSSSSTSGTISSSVGGSAITSITILSGENQADFYYMDTVDGDVTLTATATVGVPAVDKSATQILTVNYIDLLPPSISSNLADTISYSVVETQGLTIQFSETMDIRFRNIKQVK